METQITQFTAFMALLSLFILWASVNSSLNWEYSNSLQRINIISIVTWYLHKYDSWNIVSGHLIKAKQKWIAKSSNMKTGISKALVIIILFISNFLIFLHDMIDKSSSDPRKDISTAWFDFSHRLPLNLDKNQRVWMPSSQPQGVPMVLGFNPALEEEQTLPCH